MEQYSKVLSIWLIFSFFCSSTENLDQWSSTCGHNCHDSNSYSQSEYAIISGLHPQLLQEPSATSRVQLMQTTRNITSQVTYVTMVPWVGNETLRPLGVATENALSVTWSEDTYVKTPPVGRRQPMTSLPACHNISAAGRIHHQLLRLKLASEAWPEA